jgi:hypothetical protein
LSRLLGGALAELSRVKSNDSARTPPGGVSGAPSEAAAVAGLDVRLIQQRRHVHLAREVAREQPAIHRGRPGGLAQPAQQRPEREARLLVPRRVVLPVARVAAQLLLPEPRPVAGLEQLAAAQRERALVVLDRAPQVAPRAAASAEEVPR